MIKKGDQTRADIIRSARRIFAAKGYSLATMTDFCEATGLSRGGLYRHFSSTKEIMTAMLDADIEHAKAAFEPIQTDGMPAKAILKQLLDDQIDVIREHGGDLELAMFDFCKRENQQHYIRNRFDSSVAIIAGLIKYGQETQEFIDCSADETARRIVFLLEGMRISSSILSLSDELLDEQIRGIYELLVQT